MNSIVTEIANIIKSEDNYIKRERKIICFFLNLIKEIMALALARVDDEMITKVKAQGYQIDKKNERSINMAFGEVRYVRRRYVCPGKQARYPLDELMGFDKYKRYSILAVKNILEVSSVATYRNTALAVNCLSGFNISHMQVGNLVKMAGKNIKAGQEADSRYDAAGTKKKVPVLYLEGDGVVIKGTKSRLEFHRYQVCEGIVNISKKRRKRINAKEFVSLSRLDALNEAKEYLANTYDLSDTVILSNADGGAGYAKTDFDDIVGLCKRHEHFLDVFHLNKKIKERLYFAPDLQGKLISALEYKYSYDKVKTILTTAESRLIDELNTELNHDYLGRLRNYIDRHWDDIKPFKKRKLTVTKAIGCCESNHRKYTYRVKGQSKKWSKSGAEGMLRILSCIKNRELEFWLSSEFEDSEITVLTEQELKAAARDSLKKRHEVHLGIQHGALTAQVAGNSYLSKLSRNLSHINI
ncbi:ISLre2-like element ISLcr2 family transposase [Lactobacillus crispatus]|uniref:ISLre2-like element ISLcr2 family transposase n=1 Tax=Lactobacillus crispatus TaxID=47770 RepID=UPI001E5CCA7A|nr:ISLre2-like element ISLcr2 family transposase [Lactobacillus crispatus]